MAAEFDSCLFVDKPAYSSVLLALESVDLEILTSITTCDKLSQAIKPGVVDHNQKSFFMAIIKPKSILKSGDRLNLKLDELSSNGLLTEQSFYLTLNREISRKWLSNPTLKSVSPEENFLIIFQGIPVTIKALDKTIHFFASSAKVDAEIILKHYFSCKIDGNPGMPNTQMLTLSQAIIARPSSFDVFAVVRYVIKKPELTKIGSAHGMYAIIDPSIRETNQSNRGCTVHIFVRSLNVFPEIQVGDVLKLEGISIKKRQKNKNEVEFIAREDNPFIVFPNCFDWKTPKSAAHYFKITESDFQLVSKLKEWWRDLVDKSMPNTPKSAQKPSSPRQVETARQNKRSSQNMSSHEEHLVEENEQSPNLKSCKLTDLSTQSQNDEQRQSSTNQSVLCQQLKNLTNKFPSFPLEEQGRVIHEIDLLFTISSFFISPSKIVTSSPK